MPFYKFLERVNLLLYDNKDQVLRLGKILNVLISLGAVLVLVYYYGFQHEPQQETFLMNLIKFSFGFYVLHYLVRFIYDFRLIDFIRRTWFEGTIMFLLTIEGISYNLFDTLLFAKLASGLGIESFADVSTVFIQIYILIVVMIGLGRGSISLPKYKLNPALIFLVVFILIILVGTGLLMLPEMTTQAGSMNFIDALFTSTSATCVTGLMVEDAATFFTLKGQVVLLVLIKLGGLNIIAFGSFLALASRFGLQAKQHEVLEDFVNKDSLLSSRGMLGKVILWSSSIELVGAVLLYRLSDADGVTLNNGMQIFHAIFHSISAFNNAGISLLTDGFMNPSVVNNYFVHWVLIVLMFMGALGMVAIFELFGFSNLRDRMQNTWKQISFMTKIAVYFSIGLTVVGSMLILFIEQGQLGNSWFSAFTTAVFQSATTRTAGFNTVDIGSLGMPTLFLMIVLMFIGASSSSTGGGIKTSTFAVILADVLATVRRANKTELFKRTISDTLKARAYAVFMFFLVINIAGVFILLITEPVILAVRDQGVMDLVFEQVSAMSTVGLSTGITAMLTVPGKLWIIFSMLVGRVGTLTVVYAIGIEAISKNYKYPNGHTMIG